MGVIENAKELAELIKRVGDVELYRRIVELEGEVIELTRQLRASEQKVEELQQKLRTTATLTFKEPFYYAENDPAPYCPRCFEAERVVIHLHHAYTDEQRSRYDCQNCGKMYLVDHAHRRPPPSFIRPDL